MKKKTGLTEREVAADLTIILMHGGTESSRRLKNKNLPFTLLLHLHYVP